MLFTLHTQLYTYKILTYFPKIKFNQKTDFRNTELLKYNNFTRTINLNNVLANSVKF